MVSSGRNAFWLLTSGSMSTEFAASPLMGTAKLPNPTAPMKAANHPTTALGSDIVSPRVRGVIRYTRPPVRIRIALNGYVGLTGVRPPISTPRHRAGRSNEHRRQSSSTQKTCQGDCTTVPFEGFCDFVPDDNLGSINSKRQINI